MRVPRRRCLRRLPELARPVVYQLLEPAEDEDLQWINNSPDPGAELPALLARPLTVLWEGPAPHAVYRSTSRMAWCGEYVLGRDGVGVVLEREVVA